MRKTFAALLFSIALIAPAFADAPYITKQQLDVTHLLPPPPQPGSDAQQRDIATVLLARANATEAERERAFADADISIYRFADILGPRFRKDRLPKTDAFFARVLEAWGPVVGEGKAFWHHNRPFVMDPNVQSQTEIQQGVCNSRAGSAGSPATQTCPSGVSYSYPSGHSTFGTMTALILGEMVPEKRPELIARGWQYGWSRVIVGAHFLTDIEAGRVQGTVMFVLMMQNPQFRADLAEARAELRKRLGLPPAAP